MRSMGFFLNTFLVFFFFFIASSAAAGESTKVPALFVLGDSLVDVGNNNYLLLSVSKANYPHNGVDFPSRKPTGRFCNGKNAADFVAEKLGLASPPPYLKVRKSGGSSFLNGVSFASGGAGIFNSSDQALGQAIPLSKQVEHYLSVRQALEVQLSPSAAEIHLQKSVFVIVIGSNDLFDYLGTSDLLRKQDPEGYTTLMAAELKEQLKRLYDGGARKFLVMGVAVIGCIPGQRVKQPSEECNEEANLWCQKYNEALNAMLRELKVQLPGMSYSYFDNYNAALDVVNHPSAYGFTEVKAACCGLGKLNAKAPCLPTSRYCPDRANHLFWDRYGHPTEQAARVFVDLLFRASSPFVSPISVDQLLAIN